MRFDIEQSCHFVYSSLQCLQIKRWVADTSLLPAASSRSHARELGCLQVITFVIVAVVVVDFCDTGKPDQKNTAFRKEKRKRPTVQSGLLVNGRFHFSKFVSKTLQQIQKNHQYKLKDTLPPP